MDIELVFNRSSTPGEKTDFEEIEQCMLLGFLAHDANSQMFQHMAQIKDIGVYKTYCLCVCSVMPNSL